MTMTKLKLFFAILILPAFIMSCNDSTNITYSSGNMSYSDREDWAKKYSDEHFNSDPKVKDFLSAMIHEDTAEMEKLVEGGFDINTLGKDDLTPTHAYYIYIDNDHRNDDVFKRALELGADASIMLKDKLKLSLALLVITMTDRTDQLQWMIDNGLDVNVYYEEKKSDSTLLIAATESGFLADHNQAFKKVKLLVEAGADVNQTDGFNASPFTTALTMLQYRSALFLLQSGADPDYKDSPFHDPIWQIRQQYVNPDHQAWDYRNQLVAELRLRGYEIGPYYSELSEEALKIEKCRRSHEVYWIRYDRRQQKDPPEDVPENILPGCVKEEFLKTGKLPTERPANL